MGDIRYFAKPGIDMSGLVPPDAERMTREQLEERFSEITTEAEANDKREGEELLSMTGYQVVCYEDVQGNGPVCWYGEQKYLFDTLEAARKFINERLSVLGERSEDFRLCDESGELSNQYLVTTAITSIEKVSLIQGIEEGE